MTRSPLRLAFLTGITASLAGCSALSTSDAPYGDSSMIANEADGTNWASYGRTYSESHASPLAQVRADNIAQLGLAWSLELPDMHSAATQPLAVDGVIYFTVDQSKVHAVDAISGKLLWQFDPQAAKVAGAKLRRGWGARGIAYWEGKIFVGTTDGRLIGIDAKTGKQLWSAMTVDKGDARTITGAPRAFDGLVLIGHAGADAGPVRGYVTAYDAQTGAQKWRFFIVPGNPADGFEDEAQEMAAKTWTGQWWKYGGGGTAWNAFTYDPDFDTVYIGTGNGAPWNQKIRSPGGGDNLFLGSVVALDAKTGKYKWHYQENPANTWDFNSVMDMTLADLTIGRKKRKVLLHAPKNGFFYVIDRATGKPISAEKFVPKVTWAERIDLKTGRPVENPAARYPQGIAEVWPASTGAHAWQPQSFNARTGLVYIPTLSIPGKYADIGVDPKTWRFNQPGSSNLGLTDGTANDIPTNIGTSALLAWDPVAQKKIWSVPTPGFWNGGTMTTFGNLVFQGQADGYLVAYAADTGRKLWSFYAGMGITGSPISFTAGGKQYISVVAGWGASGAGYLGSLAAQHGWVFGEHQHRLLTFAIGGKAALPADLPKPHPVAPIDDPAMVVKPDFAKRGALEFTHKCVSCHGAGAVAAGFAPDLRASGIPLSSEAFTQVVKNGLLEERGMPRFAELNGQQLEDIRHYLRQRARETMPTTPK